MCIYCRDIEQLTDEQLKAIYDEVMDAKKE